MIRSKALMVGLAAFGFGVGGVSLIAACSDDAPAKPAVVTPGDGSTAEAEAPVSIDTNPCERIGEENCPTKAPPQKEFPTAVAFNLRPQPKEGVQPIIFPFLNVTNAPVVPARAPDAFTPGVFDGLGCVGYKLSLVPGTAGFASFNDLDMGVVKIGGFTGGMTLFSHQPIPNPITCTRVDPFGAGLFGYKCDAPNEPVTGFFAVGDQATLTVAGGADEVAFTSNTTPSPNDNIVVTEDLYNITPAMIDGSGDLTIHYTCGGQPCGNASAVGVIIQTSDAPSGDAGANPLAFPDPQKSFGLVQCQDLLSFYPSAFTVPKALLATIPTGWTFARVVVATVLSKNSESPDGQTTVFGVGQGVMGVTRR